jgi:anti-sigma B factor antagonist
MPLKIGSKEKTPGILVISLIGSLDTQTHGIFDDRIDRVLKGAPQLIVLDMEHLDYISSIGISSILKTKKAMKKIDGKLTLMHLQPQVKKVFDIINALPSQRIFTSTRELDEYLDRMQRSIRGEEPA